jgi:hypothetical protein
LKTPPRSTETLDIPPCYVVLSSFARLVVGLRKSAKNSDFSAVARKCAEDGPAISLYSIHYLVFSAEPSALTPQCRAGDLAPVSAAGRRKAFARGRRTEPQTLALPRKGHGKEKGTQKRGQAPLARDKGACPLFLAKRGDVIALVEGLNALGLTTATAAQVQRVIEELYPKGTEGIDQGEVLRVAFLHLKRQNSADNVRR